MDQTCLLQECNKILKETSLKVREESMRINTEFDEIEETSNLCAEDNEMANNLSRD